MDPDEVDLIPEDDSVFESLVYLQDSVQSDALLEDSFSSIQGIRRPGSPIHASTPTVSKGRRRTSDRIPGSSSTRLPCPHCNNTYAYQRTLDVHKRVHAMKSVSSRLSNEGDLKYISVSLTKDVLQELIKESVPAQDSQDLKKLCQVLLDDCDCESVCDVVQFLGQKFYETVKTHNVLLPSSLRSALYVKTNKLFATEEFRSHIRAKLETIYDGAVEIINLFIRSFVLKFFNKLLAYTMRKLHAREPVLKARSTVPEVQSSEFQQTLYHIIGSIIHGFFVKGILYNNSSNWKAYCDVLNASFVRHPEVRNQCTDSVSAFSTAKDRGGYIYCNEEAFDFFIKLFELLMSMEGEDGSLSINEVDQEVCEDDTVLFLWDDLVGTDLTEEQSLDLLMMICHSCTKVVVKGIIKRRLNNELKAAYSSVIEVSPCQVNELMLECFIF